MVNIDMFIVSFLITINFPTLFTSHCNPVPNMPFQILLGCEHLLAKRTNKSGMILLNMTRQKPSGAESSLTMRTGMFKFTTI